MYINKVIAAAILGFSLSAFALEQAPSPARGQLLRDERKLEHDLRKDLAHARPGRPFRRSEPLVAELIEEDFDSVDRAAEAKGKGGLGGRRGRGRVGKGKGRLVERAEEVEELELLDEEDFESVDRAAEAKGKVGRGGRRGKGRVGKGKGRLVERAEEVEEVEEAELLDEEDFESVDRAAEAKGRPSFRGARVGGKGRGGKGRGKGKGKVARRNEGSEMAELDLDEEEIGDVVANINAKGFGRLGKIGAVKGLAGKGKLGGKLGGKAGKLGKGKGKA